MRTIQFIAVAWVLIFLCSCKDYSTQDLLGVRFPIGGQRGLQVVAPSLVTIGQPFTVTVRATNSVLPEGIQQDFQNPTNLSLQVGGGTLSNVQYGGWFLGRQNVTLVYNNPAVGLNSSETILLKATDTLNSDLPSSCNNIQAQSQVVFNQFKIVAPGIAFKNQAFDLTITATNSDNSTNTTYNGTVNLSTYLVAGTVTPSSVTGFVNGVATVSVTLSESYSSLQLRAVDSVATTISGLSNTFQVYFDSVAFVAFPQTATSVRAEWHFPTTTTQALIYRDSGSGFQLLQTVFAPTNYYTDLGLTTGTQYTYRVVVQNNLATVQYTATMAATPSGCTTTTSGAITSATWTSAGSPYCVTGNITVSGTLTINPGVVVLVNPGFSITIGSGGTLFSQGTNANPITMTSSNVSPVAGDWGGVIFASGAVGSVIASDNYASGSKLEYTKVEYAGPGVTTAESLYLENCTIQNNRGTVLNGAGISATMPAGRQIVIKNSLILNNLLTTTPLSGGGLYSDQRVAIYSSLFSGNSVSATVNGAKGGAAYLGADSNLITSTQFINNSLGAAACCHGGGAVYLAGNSSVLTGNSFLNNYVAAAFTAQSGAVHASDNNNTFTNNLFSGNSLSSNSNPFGAAMAIMGLGNVLTRNTFSANFVNTGHGGAVHVASGNTLTYNQFTQNIANSGGAIRSAGTIGTVTHNNLYSNTATSATNSTNVWSTSSGTVDFTNNFWGGPTSGQTAMGICDASNTGGSCGSSAGTINASGAVSTAWPLCKIAPSDPNCVGANF